MEIEIESMGNSPFKTASMNCGEKTKSSRVASLSDKEIDNG